MRFFGSQVSTSTVTTAHPQRRWSPVLRKISFVLIVGMGLPSLAVVSPSLSRFSPLKPITASADASGFPQLSLYAGYANNTKPSPWMGSPNTNFVGTSGPNWESPAVRIDNPSSTEITVSDVSVSAGATTYDLWGSNAVPANGSLVLTETSPGNFDIDDNYTSCGNAGVIPAINVTINGSTATFLDSGDILIAGGSGYDVSHCVGSTLDESHAWVQEGGLGPTGTDLIGWPQDQYPTTCSTAQPVNCMTGDFWHSFTDFAIPGRGLSLNFARTYNSAASGHLGPLGFGWTHSYNVSLATDKGGNPTITEESGATIEFAAVGSTYRAPSRVLANLVKNADGSYTLTRIDKSKLTFNAGGKLTSEQDRNGHTTAIAYLNGNISTVSDPAGRQLVFAYGANGLIATVTDPAGRKVSFGYDSNGNLTSATDVASGLTRFAYDGNHQLLTMTDARSGVLTNTYDGSGRVIRQSDPMNRITTYAYGASSTTITDPNSSISVQQFKNYELASVTQGQGTANSATWTYGYDSATNAVNSVTDPNGHVTKTTHDMNGNVVTSTDPLGRVTTYTYNGFNEVLTNKDPLGITTTNVYDANGNKTSTSRPLTGTPQSAMTSYQYDPNHPGDVVAAIDPNGNTSKYAYDSYGNLVSMTDPLGNQTTSAFDVVGEKTSQVTPKGNITGGNPASYRTSVTYTAFGDTASVTDPLGHKTTHQYDGNRNLVSTSDADARTTAYTYDADNELTQTTRADGSILRAGFDGNGNIVTQTNGLGNPTTYSYDPLNRMSSVTDSLGRKTAYSYDGIGNRTGLTDPSGRTTSFARDAANQLTGITYSDGSTPNVSLSYDAAGRRLGMTDGSGNTSYGYDSLNRLTQSTNGAGRSVTYRYDLAGRLTGITYPGGTHTVARSYDADGHLTGVTDWLGHTTSFRYDVNSNRTSQIYPNTVTANFSYDNADRLAGFTDAAGQTQILGMTYSRDAIGALSAENTQSYGYDSLNRITTFGGVSLTYDAGDHLTETFDNSSDVQWGYSYDAADELVQKILQGNLPHIYQYTYDRQGNRTKSQIAPNNVAISQTFDQASRLTNVTTLNTAQTVGQYSYNGDGLRMSKTTSGGTESFTWDVVEGLPLLIQDGATSYVTGPNGLPLEQISSNGAVLYYHQDQLGSTRAITNASGAVVATYTYDAFGNATTTGNISNPFQFAGQYIDSETSYYYMRARYYDPTSGQFISRDPLSASTWEPYVYTNDSPLNGVDPSGLLKGQARQRFACLTCAQMLQEISGWASFMKGKATAIEENPGGLPLKGPSGSVESHQASFRGYQQNLLDMIQLWEGQNCGSFADLPETVQNMATSPVPQPRSVQQPAQSQATATQPTAAPDNSGLVVGGGLAGAAAVIWWLGKLASPACGPALPVCAVVF